LKSTQSWKRFADVKRGTTSPDMDRLLAHFGPMVYLQDAVFAATSDQEPIILKIEPGTYWRTARDFSERTNIDRNHRRHWIKTDAAK